MLSGELQHFHLNSTLLLSDKNAHAERLQTTNRILCHERETLLKLNFLFFNFSIQKFQSPQVSAGDMNN